MLAAVTNQFCGLRASVSASRKASEAVSYTSWRSRRKLGQILNADFLLKTRDLIDHLLEAVFTKKLVLFVLELFTKRVVLIGCDDLSKGRKQHRILTRGMRSIHSNELPQ